MASSPFAAASPEKLNEIVRESELVLAAQLTIAIAADQRALTFAGLLVAGIAAMLGLAATGSSDVQIMRSLFWIGSALFVAAGLALWSARPTPWNIGGNIPRNWLLDDGTLDNDSMLNSLAAMAGYYDKMIGKNDEHIKWAGRAMTVSLIITGITLLVALASFGTGLYPR